MSMGKGILSGLFWGGAASMIVLMAASLYFPLRDISDRAAGSGSASGSDRALLADPPSSPPGAAVQDTVAAPALPVPQAETAPEAPSAQTPVPPLTDTPTPPAVAEAPSAPPVAPEVPAGPGPEVAGTSPEGAGRPARVASAPESAAPNAPDTAPEPQAARVPGLPTPDPSLDAPLGDAVAAAQAPIPTPEVASQTQRPPPTAVPGSAPAIARAEAVLPPRATQPAALASPRPAASPPKALTPLAPAPQPALETPRAAVPEEPEAQDLADLARPASPPPRLALAPTDLPFPPVVAAPVAPGRAPAPARAPEPAPPEDAPPPVVAEPAPAPNTPAPEDRRTAQVAPTPELPRRLVLDSADPFGARGPGLSARIPRIGETPAVATVPEPAPEAVGALARNALSFAADATLPRLSLVLRATSDARAITDILSRLAVPVAVALDPTWPEADARAAELRAAGHEVLITLTGLPEPAEPRDIDTALAVHIARLPGAVGVWLPQTSPVFGDRELLRHLVAVLSDTGHGLVAPLSGLDAPGQEARAAGLPSVSIARRIGGAEAGQAALQRSLDQGALRAGADGRAVLLGETRTETLMALRDWAEGVDPATLTLAPVSALLLDPAL